MSSIAPNPGDQVLITFEPGERITLMPAVVDLDWLLKQPITEVTNDD